MAHRMSKLRAMSGRELASRLAYEAYVSYERARHRRGLLARADRLRHDLQPSISRQADWRDALVSEVSRTCYFRSLDSRDRLRETFAGRFSRETAKARRIASEILSGEVSFFGRRFPLGTRMNWHSDPVTGAVWPRTYHRDVPIHGGDVGFGDVKYVWEANRHQFFVDLAKVAFLDRSQVHAAALQHLLRDWSTAVPYATGAPWACALEPAFRTWSWLWAYYLLRAAEMLDTDSHVQWLTGFSDHARFLYRHLERFSSPYNHLIGEASALFAVGSLFPFFREADAWAARGRRVLESTLVSQFHADGASVEQSTFYHHATLGFYILAAVLGRRNGAELSSDVWSAIERGIQFSASVVQPDGRIPRIGGADDGKPIRMEHLPLWDFRPYQAIGAVLFLRPDFKFVAGRFWEDALWILGPEAADTFDHLDRREPRPSAALPASGYYVVRSGWSAEADYLCFDCGPQAAGLRADDVPSAAHGHADCLSVVVTLGGREVLVDPGFYCYNGDPLWEVAFRRTAAHNTVSVDGRDQARHVSKMAWTHTFAARFHDWSAEDGWARGSHDGYVRNAAGVTHQRTAWLRGGGYVVIYDELTGPGLHTVEAVFQFAPGRVSLNASNAVFNDRFELAWICSTPVTAHVTCGGDTPGSGWIAPSLGVRQPAPRVSLQFQLSEGRCSLLTVLADKARISSMTCELEPRGDQIRSGLLRAEVIGLDFSDTVVAALAGTVATDDVSTDAPLVVIRRAAGLIEVFHAGGTGAQSKAPAGASAPLQHVTVLK